MDEAVVDARLFGELTRRDVRIPDADEQPFGRIEERLFRVFACLGDAQTRALR